MVGRAASESIGNGLIWCAYVSCLVSACALNDVTAHGARYLYRRPAARRGLPCIQTFADDLFTPQRAAELSPNTNAMLASSPARLYTGAGTRQCQLRLLYARRRNDRAYRNHGPRWSYAVNRSNHLHDDKILWEGLCCFPSDGCEYSTSLDISLQQSDDNKTVYRPVELRRYAPHLAIDLYHAAAAPSAECKLSADVGDGQTNRRTDNANQKHCPHYVGRKFN